MHYLCSEIKGADQLRGYCEADLHLCFHICKGRFSHMVIFIIPTQAVVHVQYQMSRVTRKPTFRICENKDTDQLRGNRETDQRFCFRRMNNPSTSLIQYFKHLAIFCDCTARFVSDLVGHPDDRFSRDAVHIKYEIFKQKSNETTDS